MSLRTLLLLLVSLISAASPLFAQPFVFHLSGAQEVPPVNSGASCMGELDQPASTFTLTCVHNVIGATVTHPSRAGRGQWTGGL